MHCFVVGTGYSGGFAVIAYAHSLPGGLSGEGQPLEEHLGNVSAGASALAAKIGLASSGQLIGLLHDLGKYSSEFQTYLGSAVGRIDPDSEDFVDACGLKGKIDHSTAGAQVVWDALSKQGDVGVVVGQILALCIASHHSGLIDCLSSDSSRPVQSTFMRRMGKPDDRTHRRESSARMSEQTVCRLREMLADPGLICGLKESVGRIMVRDGINGGDPLRNPIIQFKIGLLVRFLFSCLIDADRMDTADSQRPKIAKRRPNGKYVEWGQLIDRLEHGMQGIARANKIDDVRSNISERCRESGDRERGIFTLTVPTGGGKTLASLRFALRHAQRHKMDRVIFIVPFTTIIDQNAQKVRAILEPNRKDRGRVVLEHHSNLTPEQQSWREKMLTENWDAPVVYTTSVHLLETLFGGGTRGARRMHQLANSVLVFDEIQALPVNCVHLFCNAMNFMREHCGSTVVLCTATQPLLHLVDASKGAMKYTHEDELMPDVKALFDHLKRTEVLNRRKSGGWTNEEVACLALDEVKQSGSCLVIVNTKKSALALFRLLKGRANCPVYHLSTNMCPAHRKKSLGYVRDLLFNQNPVLCVSTQLIEAGVDVDFGAVIRFTAGLDSIAQAAGRCNRNGRAEKGRVHVVNPAVEDVNMLKDIQCAKGITERILDDVDAGVEDFDGDLLGPKAMARYFDYYFFARREEMAYPVSAQTVGRDDTLLNLLSINGMAVDEYGRNHGESPNTYLRQSFMAAGRAFKAIDAPTRGIIVPYDARGKKLIGKLCGAFEVDKQFKLLREAQQYSVNVFPHVLQKLQKAEAVHTIQEDVDILYLSDGRYYHQESGLSETPEGEMEVLHD